MNLVIIRNERKVFGYTILISLIQKESIKFKNVNINPLLYQCAGYIEIILLLCTNNLLVFM